MISWVNQHSRMKCGINISVISIHSLIDGLLSAFNISRMVFSIFLNYNYFILRRVCCFVINFFLIMIWNMILYILFLILFTLFLYIIQLLFNFFLSYSSSISIYCALLLIVFCSFLSFFYQIISSSGVVKLILFKHLLSVFRIKLVVLEYIVKYFIIYIYLLNTYNSSQLFVYWKLVATWWRVFRCRPDMISYIFYWIPFNRINNKNLSYQISPLFRTLGWTTILSSFYFSV